MFNFCKKIFAAIILLIFLFPLKIYSQEKIKNIVVFFAYNSSPSYQNILEGFKSTVSLSKDKPVNLMVEYLDIGRSENDDYPRFIIDLYNKKLREIKIDLFVTVGPGINSLLFKYNCKMLDSLPVVNLDIAVPDRISLKDSNFINRIDILSEFRVSKTLKDAFTLFPEYKNVYIISGSGKFDIYFTSLIRNCLTEYKRDYNFVFLPEAGMDSTLQLVRRIPQKSIIIVSSYLQDAIQVPFSTAEALNMISKNSLSPVFPVTASFKQKESGIGGYLFNFTNVGKEIGRISLEILNGKPLKDISVSENDFYEYSYDYQELKKWHLTGSKALPMDSKFYNKDASLLIVYKWYILGILLFITSQSILIVYLIRLNRRQIIITERMIETESMHRELIRTDRLSKMSTLTASLSHELYQPLAAIRFTAQAGKRYIQTGNLDMDRASRMFENILEDDIRATGIISSVKNLMTIETPEMRSVDLNALTYETLNIIRKDVEKHRIKINIICDKDPVFVFGNKILLQQVLMNFIRNSVIAMEKSNPENRVLEIILKQDRELVIVSVRDSGTGIDNAIIEKLFKPFVTTRKEGFGIGLTLCKSIIENHNGKIWGENMPEGGTVFSFSLKVIKNESHG